MVPTYTRRRRKHFSQAWRLFACRVPYARFAEVHIDVGVAFERRSQHNECGACVSSVTCHVHVIQKRIEEVVTRPEFGVRRQKGRVDADCEKARHEGVALFSPFRLGYLVCLS